MRILFLTHTFPYPLDDGIKLHVYYLLKQLSRTNTIFLLSLTDRKVAKESQTEIEKLGIDIAGIVEHKIPKSPWSRLANCLFDPVPFFVRQFESKIFRDALQNFLAKEKIDVIHADYLSMVIYQDSFQNTPAVAFPHDAMSMLFKRSAQQEKNPLRRIYLNIQARKTLSFEKACLRKFNNIAVVSEIDKKYLLQNLGLLNIAVVTNGVDSEYFAPRPELEAEEPTILFRGVMSFFPNHDAAYFFYREILSLIRQKIPNTRFIVAGKNPSPVWQKYKQKDSLLRVTAYVDDMRPYMAQTQVVVCPMRAASGIQNKILEPMAMAKAVVATPLACEGLGVKDGQELLLADNPSSFAQKTIGLLENKSLREKVGQAARNYICQHHKWETNAQIFEKLYKEAVGI